MYFGASPSPVIEDEGNTLIDLKEGLTEEFAKKLIPSKKIMIQECYFIKDLNKVIVIATLVDRDGTQDDTNDPYMTVRFNSEYEPKIKETRFNEDANNKNYFDELKKEYSDKEIIRFYHCDPLQTIQEDKIYVRGLPDSTDVHCKRLDSQIERNEISKQNEAQQNRTSSTWFPQDKLLIGGAALLFAGIVSVLIKPETVGETLNNVFDGSLKKRM